MKRFMQLMAAVLAGGLVLGGYVWWSQSAEQQRLSELRNRRVEPIETAPASLETPAENEENDEAEVLSAGAILESAEAKWDEIQDYHCTTISFARQGDETDDKVLDIVFKRPALYRSTVIEGDNQGAVVTYNRDGVIHGMRGGALSLIVLTLEPDDERLRSLRGKRFFETAWGNEMEDLREFLAEGWTLERLPDADLDGRACYVISAQGTSADNPVTRSDMWIEKSTHLLRRCVEYEGETLVRDAKFTEIEINADPDDAQFSLK